MRDVHRVSAALVCAGSVLWSWPASAEREKVAAEALFDEGRRLMGEGKVADACPKFAASQKLDPAPGTLLNLADCYEKNGQTASAWAAFREAAAAARAENRADFEQTANRRATALSGKLSRLTIAASRAQGLTDLEVTCDGRAVTEAEWSVPVPIDPGERAVEVKARGKKPWKTVVHVKADGDSVTVTVPVLEDEPVAPPSVAPQPPDPRTAPLQATASQPVGTPTSSSSSLKVVGYTLGAVGLVGLGVGGVFALSAKSKYDDSLALCRPTSPNECSTAGVSLREDARVLGNVATLGVVAGAALLAGGVTLVLLSPSAKEAAGTRPTASLVTSGTDLRLQGTW